jgi:hypothetical protein
MKWSLLRLIEAPHARRRAAPPAVRRQNGRSPSGPQRDAPPDTQLPHRGLALRALRQLARGHFLVVGGQTAFAVRLAGVPDVVHLAQDLIARGLVEPVDLQECGAPCYTLSAAGRDALDRGEQWWREMTPLQRLVVEFTG